MILTTHAKTRAILHNDWSTRLGENKPDWALQHLGAMLFARVKIRRVRIPENIKIKKSFP